MMKRAFLFSVFLLVLVSLLEWRTGWLQSWVKNRAVRAYVEKLQPHLPFQVERVELGSDWKELLRGRITDLRLTLRMEQWRFHLKGPLTVHPKRPLKILYHPQVTLVDLETDQTAPPFPMEILLQVDQDQLQSARIRIQQSEWVWRGLEWSGLDFSVDLEDDRVELQLRPKGVTWTSADESVAVDLQGLQIQAQTTTAGKRVRFEWSLEHLEALVQDRIFSLDFPKRFVDGQVDLEKKSLSMQDRLGFWEWELHPEQFSWKTKKLPFDFPFRALGGMSGAPDGRWRSEGVIGWNGESFDLKTMDVDGWLEMQDVSYQSSDLALKGLSGYFPIHTQERRVGRVSFEQFQFQRFGASMEKMSIDLEPISPLRWKFKSAAPKIVVDDINLILAPIVGWVDADQKDFEVRTRARLNFTSLLSFTRGVCLPSQHVPPAVVSADFPEVEIRKDRFRAKGQATVSLFEGQAQLKNIQVFDLLSAVPEIQFDAEWKNIRLDQLGQWLQFGKMDGTFDGYVRDVTMQSWLPTQYDLLVRVQPDQHRQIVFSPEAMRHTVQLVSGEDLDETLPGYANWLAFGWLSSLFGGYNVDYAGFSLFSRDGSILLKTLDPPEVVQKEGKHFILYGTRFKIPIESERYPVVLDAPGVSNLVRHMAGRLGSLKKTQNDEKKDQKNEPCIPE